MCILSAYLPILCLHCSEREGWGNDESSGDSGGFRRYGRREHIGPTERGGPGALHISPCCYSSGLIYAHVYDCSLNRSLWGPVFLSLCVPSIGPLDGNHFHLSDEAYSLPGGKRRGRCLFSSYHKHTRLLKPSTNMNQGK